MRHIASLLVPLALLVPSACGGGHATAPTPAPAPAPTASAVTCEEATRVAGVYWVSAEDDRIDAPELDEARATLVAGLAGHCAADAWSAEVRACFAGVTSYDGLAPCSTQLTSVQRAHYDEVVATMQAGFAHYGD